MRYLITGITGSLGTALLEKLIKNRDDSVVGISRNEYLQWKLKNTLQLDPDRHRLITADICNPNTYKEYLKNLDCIIHTAALKHVESDNLSEYIRVNLEGTQKLFPSRSPIRKIFISTDKVCEAASPYGHTKALGESIALNTCQIVIRLGNFTVSHGNLLELFSIKDPDCFCAGMTRFFMRTEDVADFVLRMVKENRRGCVCVPKMKTAVIGDVFKAYDKPINETRWFRPGEKMHETLISSTDRPVRDMGDWFMIGEPLVQTSAVKKQKGFMYKSNENSSRWTVEEIKEWKQL